MVALRWAIRFTGLLSTVVLARLLTPEDFGLVAMGTLVAGLLAAFTEMGTWQLLLRTKKPDREAYDTAWSITLLQSIVLSLGVFAMAYPASVWFKEPRLQALMQVSAWGGVLVGLKNIGLIMYRRDLDFRAEFKFGVLGKICNVVPTLVLALVYRHYWALVAGTLIGAALETLLSYVVHPYRPRWTMARWREFASYSIWVTPANIANFLNRKADVFFVGYLASTAQMGAYNVASELSQMATGELVQPMMRSVYPNLARLKDDLAELGATFVKVVHAVAMLGLGVGFGTAAVADDMVHLLLGDQWGAAVPLVRWLAVFGGFAILLHTLLGHILIVTHREKLMFRLTWLRLAVFSTAVVLAGTYGGIVDIARATVAATALLTVGVMLLLPRVLGIPGTAMLSSTASALVIGGLMFGAIRLVHPYLPDIAPVRLVLEVVLGSVVFSALALGLWMAKGRPDSIERRLFDVAMRRLRPQRGG